METRKPRNQRPRRSFTSEFKAEIVELCRRGDRSISQVSRDFDLTETAVRALTRPMSVIATTSRPRSDDCLSVSHTMGQCPTAFSVSESTRGSAITLYEKTIELIRRLIADQGLVPGDRLPSEAQIAAMAGVSLMTVRRAMSELVAAGALQRIQGKGTYVRSERIHAESTIIGGLKRTLALQGVALETQLVSFAEWPADDATAARLSIPAGTTTWRIERVRRFDGTPAVRETAVIPRIFAPDLDTRFDSDRDSLYEVLTEHYGLAESEEDQTLIARPASALEARDLALTPGSAAVEITGVSTTSTRTAFDSFQMIFVPAMFAFRLRSAPTADPLALDA